MLRMHKTGAIQGRFLKKEREEINDSPCILMIICHHYVHSCPFDELRFLEEMELSPSQ